MSDFSKDRRASHLSRAAFVYIRQSTAAQVEHNRESTQRQYALAARASALGWPAQQVVIVDDDPRRIRFRRR
jgi:DNA invertase Pin-like site-specific DNA recombinase